MEQTTAPSLPLSLLFPLPFTYGMLVSLASAILVTLNLAVLSVMSKSGFFLSLAVMYDIMCSLRFIFFSAIAYDLGSILPAMPGIILATA
jgi:hypothetical protein